MIIIGDPNRIPIPGNRRPVRCWGTRVKFRFSLYIVAKLNVFGIKLKIASNDQNPPFLDLFIIARKMHSPTLLQCLQKNKRVHNSNKFKEEKRWKLIV
jgi:hypothetical protein